MRGKNTHRYESDVKDDSKSGNGDRRRSCIVRDVRQTCCKGLEKCKTADVASDTVTNVVVERRVEC